ncbi:MULTISPECIES: LysE family translocator [Marinobacterium]|uniref:Threonine/homoserine/homoserine lactone efflux protein n=2 Tax=Marinobacterium TaxID=48075 RepID=A0A1H6AP93_9GAMM|nr:MULTISPECIES: LysE family translocator [Marinobacterium]TCK07480.1 threonine/homoserine/homoserine lactone efflux protein [Marinobacterium mangrovicola]SEG50528.1 Threonine/homoserine/homoserine lactone efflux protein [Marinobacterium lutimaris]
MSFESWSLFCLASLLVILIPGPLSLLMVANSLNHGIRRSLPAFVGGTLASLILLTASATGLGALLAASETLFSVIRYAGACYLIWLGYKAWREASQGTLTSDSEPAKPLASRMFVRAFTLGISNPKDILFFVAFLPQFISADTALLPQLLVMCLSWCVLDLICKLAYGGGARLLTPVLKNGRNLEHFNRASAGLFVGIGSVVLIK